MMPYIIILVLSFDFFSVITTCILLLLLFNEPELLPLPKITLISLHISFLLEAIVSLPNLFQSYGFCKEFGLLHYYFGFVHIACVSLLGFIYWCDVINEELRSKINPYWKNFRKYYGCQLFVLVLPLITIIPYFIDPQDYGVAHEIYCTAKFSDNAQKWAFGVFYGPVWILIIFNLISLCHVYSLGDYAITKDYFKMKGSYIIATIICWIPRTVARLCDCYDDNALLGTSIFLFLEGILYAYCYYTNDRNLNRPSRLTNHSRDAQMDRLNLEENSTNLSSIFSNTFQPAENNSATSPISHSAFTVDSETSSVEPQC